MDTLFFYFFWKHMFLKYCLNYHQIFIHDNLTYIHYLTISWTLFSTFFGIGTGGGLVQERRLAKDGKYNICIHVDGSWKTITVDDRIPCLRGKGMMTVKREEREVNTTSPLQSPPPLQNLIPAFGRSSTKNELWVSLLEKAIAKHYGSYEAITGGLIHVAMSLLTGGIGQMVLFNY